MHSRFWKKSVMSDGSAWVREALSIKQIPTLQALLRCCDEGLLIRVIVDEHVVRVGDWDGLSPKRRRTAEKRLAATIATMCSLPLDKKRARGSLLLPNESFVLHARSELVERRVSAALVALDDVPRAHRAVECYDAELLRRVPGKLLGEDEGPRCRAYTLDPWEQTLASRVWLGGLWCCRERYLVLASAFWEMTYLGFEYDRVCARRVEKKARCLIEEDASVVASRGAKVASSGLSSAAEERRRQAEAYGLVEPDRFERDYFDRLAASVAQLNVQGHRAFCLRLIDVAERLGKV